ncbi:MAG: site-specific integrase [Desulfobulbaceae bacterium]|nr:site-specific integrase [Desulfobulbaceae bacterium]
MAVQWLNSGHKGVRFYYHPTRKYKGQRDRYFAIRYQLQGKRIEEGLGWLSEGWTENDAVLARAEHIKNAKTGEGPTSLQERREEARERKAEKQRLLALEEEKKTTVSEYGKSYREWSKMHLSDRIRKVEKQTCTDYIDKYLGDRPAHSLSEIDIQRFRKKISELSPRTRTKDENAKLSPRTIESILLVLGKILKYAGVKDRPTSKVRAPKYDNRVQRYFTKEEVEKLFAKLKEKSQVAHNQALLALECGLRAKEVFSLRKMHCDFNSGAIKIVDSKNKSKSRMVYMTPGVREILLRQTEKKKPHELVFPTKEGAQQKYVNAVYYRVIAELELNKGIKDRRFRAGFHTLRHTFASWLIMSGRVSLYDLQKLLGHEDIRTTERYAHLAPDRLKESATVMDELRNQPPEESAEKEAV